MNFFNRHKNLPLAEITPAIISGWKIRYGEVFEITANGKTAYFKELTNKDVKKSLDKIFDMEALKIAHLFLDATWLGGDKEFIKDDTFKMIALDKLGDRFEKKIRITYPNITALIK